MQQTIYKKDSHLEFDYLVYRPKNTDDCPLPLLIFLHGSGEIGDDLNNLKCHSVPRIADAPDFDLPAIVISPMINTLGDLWSYNLDKLYAFIEQLKGIYKIDETRISLTGVSMGGFGTWEMATRYPDLFAAIAPVCGGGHPWQAKNLVGIKIRAFHGASDDVVMPHYSTDMVNAVLRAGGQASLTLYHNVGHDSWEPAYEQSNVIQWLITQQKK